MSIWRTLGLTRTDDVTEIRRAYARRLKAIDVDADPAAFIAVRAAFDRALHDAESRRWQVEAPAGEANFLPGPESPLLDPTPLGQRLEPPAPPAPPESAPPEPSSPAPAPPLAEAPPPDPEAPGDDGARFVALERLLFPEDATSAPDPDALAAALREILDHPSMAAIAVSADVENWLAGILYDAVPNSDPVLATAVDHFDWEKNAGRWDNHWLFEELVRRRNALVWLQRVAQPGHPQHAAWRELTSTEEAIGFRAGLRKKAVADLLTTVRRDFPAAETYLSAHRVALWDDVFHGAAMDPDGGRGTWGWGILIFWGLLFASRLLGTQGHESTAPLPPPSPLTAPYVVTTPAGDLDPILRRFAPGAPVLALVADRNPVLHQRLIQRWNQQASAPTTSYDFEGGIRSVLAAAEREALRGGSYALQSAYWRLKADELIWLKTQDVQQCELAAHGGYLNITLPLALTGRRERIRAQALGEPLPETVRPPAPAGRSYAIPGAAVEIAMRRSGLTRDILHEAWQNRGTIARRCDAGIALIEAALALPRREGRQLLRDMSAGL